MLGWRHRRGKAFLKFLEWEDKAKDRYVVRTHRFFRSLIASPHLDILQGIVTDARESQRLKIYTPPSIWTANACTCNSYEGGQLMMLPEFKQIGLPGVSHYMHVGKSLNVEQECTERIVPCASYTRVGKYSNSIWCCTFRKLLNVEDYCGVAQYLVVAS